MSRVIADGLSARALQEVIQAISGDLPEIETLRLELGGDFNPGQEIVGVKVGPRVTLTGVGALSHASSALVQSIDNLLPEDWRPSHSQVNCYDHTGTVAYRMAVVTSGRVVTRYSDSSGGSARTNSGDIPNITYLIADDIT